jgi:hypothetical protein
VIAGAWLCMGGHLTDLKNIADCQEWRKQRLKKICMHDRKLGHLFTQQVVKSHFPNLNEMMSMRNPEVFYRVHFYCLCMTLQSSFRLNWRLWTCTAFLFILCESFFELACFNLFYESSIKEKIIFKSDLYDLNLFHFKVRVLISWRIYWQKAVNFNKHLRTFYLCWILRYNKANRKQNNVNWLYIC